MDRYSLVRIGKMTTITLVDLRLDWSPVREAATNELIKSLGALFDTSMSIRNRAPANACFVLGKKEREKDSSFAPPLASPAGFGDARLPPSKAAACWDKMPKLVPFRVARRSTM